MILLLRSGASADRRKHFLFFSDGGALPRRRYAHATEGDDGPVLKFKRRDDAQLLHRPRQVADDEAASGAPERFAFGQRANVAQAFGHDAAGGG